MANEINIWDVMIILFVHWVADFVLQTDKQAKNKSTDSDYLLQHTFVYALCFIPFAVYGGIVYNSEWMVFLFCPITFFAHTITDYITSRINARLWKQGRTHDFFVSIGFDQLLHFAQLLFTYQLLK